MNSFDVFDTLLARRYFNSEPIYQQLAFEYNIPNFVQHRKAADTGSRSFDEIYRHLAATYVVSNETSQKIKQREIELEVEHSIPVRINLDRVNDGDLLISDMYLPGSAILQMVRSVGLEKQVTIYQSNGDKSTGAIWSRMQSAKPNLHLGDHPNSDYKQALDNGVNAELYPGTHFNSYEKDIHTLGLPNLALLARECRLATTTAKNTLYTELASSLNLPFLFVAIELLRREHPDYPLVFLGRDGQMLHRIYNSYFGVAGYIPFSRKAAYSNPEVAYSYLSSHSPAGAELVDISSTGGTWQALPPINVTVLIYSDQTYYTPAKPVLPDTFNYITTNSEIGQTNLLLEVFNCGDHGHLDSINEIVPGVYTQSFGKPELDAGVVHAVQSPIQYATTLNSIYKHGVRKELSTLTKEQLVAFMQYFTSHMCSQDTLLAQAREFLEKETSYLEQFTK